MTILRTILALITTVVVAAILFDEGNFRVWTISAVLFTLWFLLPKTNLVVSLALLAIAVGSYVIGHF